MHSMGSFWLGTTFSTVKTEVCEDASAAHVVRTLNIWWSSLRLGPLGVVLQFPHPRIWPGDHLIVEQFFRFLICTILKIPNWSSSSGLRSTPSQKNPELIFVRFQICSGKKSTTDHLLQVWDLHSLKKSRTDNFLQVSDLHSCKNLQLIIFFRFQICTVLKIHNRSSSSGFRSVQS